MMKRFIKILAVALLTVSPTFAQLNTLPSGYYRVQNTATQRYAALYDNKGKIDKVSTTVDAGAIRTYYGFDRVVSDPASVIYFTRSASGYQLRAQGTTSVQILGNYYIQLRYNGKSYQAYGQQSGYSVYLSDERLDGDTKATGTGVYKEKYDSMGYMSSGGQNYKYWFFKAVDAATDNYFGFSPRLQSGTDYYQSFYAEFPFSFASSGVKAYYVDRRDDGKGVARMTEITSTEIPGKTPMIIRSTTSDPSLNRINLLTSSSATVSGNLLTGVYFCSSDNLLPFYDQLAMNHENYVLNNPSTMRVLDVLNGELVLRKVDWKYIPRNSFYMTVAAGSPDVYKLLLPEAYATGIGSVSTNRAADNAIYTLSGQKVSGGNLESLPAGVYIRNGRKVVKN